MNIAFPALFIFALALPGILLRYSYFKWAWGKRVVAKSIPEDIATSLIAASSVTGSILTP